MNPIISIIIPCYNSEKYIADTLDCILKQSIDNWEAVIVNDGSTDRCSDIAKEYASKDIRFKVVDKKNEGVAIARNTAIKASSGKYILPLDPDDLIAPTYAEKAISYLEKHEDTKLVYCECNMFGSIQEKLNLPKYNYNDFIWNCSIFCSCVYRREDFDKTVGYNPNMIYMEEDYDFLISFLNENDKVYQIPETLFFYRMHGMSRSNSRREKIPVSHLQIVMNHPDIYMKYPEKTVKFINYIDYQKKYECIITSKDYKIGYFFMKPIRLIKGYICKIF